MHRERYMEEMLYEIVDLKSFAFFTLLLELAIDLGLISTQMILVESGPIAILMAAEGILLVKQSSIAIDQ